MLPVLVLDGDQASALTIVRSLGRRGLVVHVGSSEPSPLAGYSRHVRQRLRYPDPLKAEADFIDWLRNQTSSQRYGLVIPVTERTVVPMLRHRASFDDSRVALAPSDALEQVLDKDRTLRLAATLGIATPRSVPVAALADLGAAAAALGYPVVVKPARSVGQGDGQRVQLTVSYAHNGAELEAQVRHALRYGAVILQEYFAGDGVGIELIADQGVVRHAFQHRRLHEVPLTGGGSSLRTSEAVDPALLAASTQLVLALGWHGVAMVEFKRAPASGEFRLMEINGRFWGSLPLAVAAGADFPALLHALLTTGQVPQLAPARTGVVCRQLARDIDWLEHVLRKAAPRQLVTLPTAGQVLRDCLLVFSPRHHFDVQTWRDPWPGLVDLWRIGAKQWARIAAALAGRRRLRQEFNAGRAQASGQRALAEARQVLFLCYGNINRSALAQAYAQSRHGQRLQFVSAGFHAPGGRAADPAMVDVAAGRQIDLSQSLSRTLDAQMVRDADLILAMEVAHLDRLVQQHPSARGKAFLLGAAAATEPRAVEVPDPYGKARSTYELVCRQVMASVDGWLSPAPPPQRPKP